MIPRSPLFLATLLLITSPILGQTIGPERPWSSPQLHPVPGRHVVLASNGDDAFAVWSDGRYDNVDLYASPLDGAARPVEERGRLVGATWMPDDRPELVWNGSEYLLAWGSRATIHVARVSTSGEVTGGRMLSEIVDFSGSEPASLTLAWSGSEYLIAWAWGDRSGFVLLRPDLSVIAKGPLEPVNEVAAASNGSGFLLLTTTAATVLGRPISASGEVGTPVLVRHVAGPLFPAIASDGARYFAMWLATSDLESVELNADATPSSGGTVLARNARNAGRVIWDGLGYVVAWSADLSPSAQPRTLARIQAGRFSGNGTVITPARDVAPLRTLSLEPALARSDEGIVVAWRDNEYIGPLSASLLDFGTLETKSVYALGMSLRHQQTIRVAAGESTFAGVWREGDELRFGRLSESGFPLDYDGQHLARIEIGLPYEIQFGPRGYLVAWTEPGGRLVAQRFTERGETLGDPATLGVPSFTPAIAAGASAFLVVRGGPPASPAGHSFRTQQYASIVRDGEVISKSPFPAVSSASSQTRAHAISIASHFLAAYTEAQCAGKYCWWDPEVRLLPISASGDAMGDPVSLGAGWPEAFASNGTRALLVHSSPQGGLSGTFIGPDGTPLGSPFVIEAVAEGFTSDPSAEWDGRRFVVAYRKADALVLLAIDEEGAVERSILAGNEGEEPDLAFRSNGKGVIAYTRVLTPLPEAHEGQLRRAAFRLFGMLRSRAVSR